MNYLFINFKAIGGSFGGQIDTNIFPAQFIIDYVRVYAPSSEVFPRISIQAVANNQFVTANNAGASPLIAARKTVNGIYLKNFHKRERERVKFFFI